MQKIIMPKPDVYFGYPVGNHVVAAISYAENAANVFNDTFQHVSVNIWCRGSSGAILAALFAANIKNVVDKKIIHVKKNGEKAHGTSDPIRGAENAVINVIIDDAVEYGTTLNAIYDQMTLHSIYVPDVLIISNGRLAAKCIDFKPKVIISWD
jgi:hypothetical protein